MNLEQIYTEHNAAVQAAVAQVAGIQEAENIAHDQLWEPLFCGEIACSLRECCAYKMAKWLREPVRTEV